MNHLKSLAAVIALGLGSGAAQAITLDTTTAANLIFAGNPGEPAAPSATGGDGVLQNFTGIDWHRNGAAQVDGFVVPQVVIPGVTTIDFTFTYQVFATSISSTSSTPDLRVAPPGSGVGTYEITSVGTIFERALCVTADCGTIFLSLTPNTTSTFTVYFDNSPEANQATGVGFNDGAIMFSGNFTTETPTSIFTASAAAPAGTGNGSASLSGIVTFTNPAYINPALSGSTVATDIQFPGEPPPDYTRPASINGVATGPDTSSRFVVQVDARETVVAAVPEPATLMLLGIGLLGIGAMRRRHQG